MCDYSLEMYRTQPARAGETYTVTRFVSGTIGLASRERGDIPVCVACDSRLMLSGIPQHLQDSLHVGPEEEVTLVHLEQGPYRDGIKFANGRTICLQQLSPGIAARVTMLIGHQPEPLRAPAAADLFA